MPRHTCLQRRGSVYYLRRRMPLDLCAVIGQDEIARSLQTHEFCEAVRRLHIENVKTDQLFARLRSEKQKRKISLEARALVRSWFHREDVTNAEREPGEPSELVREDAHYDLIDDPQNESFDHLLISSGYPSKKASVPVPLSKPRMETVADVEREEAYRAAVDLARRATVELATRILVRRRSPA